MRRRLGTVIASFAIAALLIGVTSCMDGGRYEEKAKAEILGYLTDKYGSEFVIKEFVPSSNSFTGTTFDVAYVHSVDAPQRIFNVHRSVADGKSDFRDGYAFVQAEDAISGVAAGIARELLGECALLVRVTSNDDVASAYDAAAAFDLAAFTTSERSHATVLVWVFMPRSDIVKENEAVRLRAVAERLSDAGLVGTEYAVVGAFFLSEAQYAALDTDQYRQAERGEIIDVIDPAATAVVQVDNTIDPPAISDVAQVIGSFGE